MFCQTISWGTARAALVMALALLCAGCGRIVEGRRLTGADGLIPFAQRDSVPQDPASHDDVAAIAALEDLGAHVGRASGRVVRVELLSPRRPFTDEHLQHLQSFTSLEVLWLHGAAITDAGLERLKPLERLQDLELPLEAPLSDKALDDLHRALPGCRIERVGMVNAHT